MLSTVYLILIALSVVMVVLIILTIISIISIRGLKRDYDSFMMTSGSRGISIEELLNNCLNETKSVSYNYDALLRRTASLEKRIAFCVQKTGVIRYNPFDDTGGDLSYVVALLDETNSGFVLNGIYNRSGSYTYAKEIENGSSISHKLSQEELQALEMAMKNESGTKKG